MKPRQTTQPTAARFGLFGWIDSRRVSLPLKGVEAEFAVRGGMAEVTVNQIFHQDNPAALDCQYLFPLPADAAVYHCEAEINGRLIRASIKERIEARQLAAAKKAAGFRTALVESERDNLFTLTLGNGQPGDLIIVRLKYIQNVRGIRQARALEIPLCPGIRYIPGRPLLRNNRGKGVVDDTNQVPDASRITPPRIESDHPEAAYVDIHGTIDLPSAEQGSISSPSHRLSIQSCDGDLLVSLADKGEAPDQDFALRWTERLPESLLFRAWISSAGEETHALLEIRAPRQAAAQETAIDFYFLVDRSGSMAGLKWIKAIDALRSCLKILGPRDRAMITFFATDYQSFAEQPLSAAQLAEAGIFEMLPRLRASGGTEMESALQHVLQVAAKFSQSRARNLILITDAQVGNESAILEVMREAPDMATHCFGIDVTLNDALLIAMTRQQGGVFHSLHPNDDIEAAVTSLAATLRQPILLNLQLPGWDCAEATIPSLYASQIVYVSARAASNNPLEVTARAASGEPIRLAFAPQRTEGRGPELQWRRGRLRRLLAEGKNADAIALSVSSNLLCPLTAFVAWDETEKVAVAGHELIHPALHRLHAFAPAAGGMENLFDVGLQADITGCCARRFMDRPALGIMAGPPEPANVSPQSAVRRQLDDACRRLEEMGCPALRSTIDAWFDRLKADEFSARFLAISQLTRRLAAFAMLLEVLGRKALSGDELMRGVEICRAGLSHPSARWNGDRDGLDDFPALLDQASAIARLPDPVRQAPLQVFLEELRRNAADALRQFFQPQPDPLGAATQV